MASELLQPSVTETQNDRVWDEYYRVRGEIETEREKSGREIRQLVANLASQYRRILPRRLLIDSTDTTSWLSGDIGVFKRIEYLVALGSLKETVKDRDYNTSGRIVTHTRGRTLS